MGVFGKKIYYFLARKENQQNFLPNFDALKCILIMGQSVCIKWLRMQIRLIYSYVTAKMKLVIMMIEITGLHWNQLEFGIRIGYWDRVLNWGSDIKIGDLDSVFGLGLGIRVTIGMGNRNWRLGLEIRTVDLD